MSFNLIKMMIERMKKRIMVIRLICLVGIGLSGTLTISNAQQKENTLKALERHEDAVYILQENIQNPFIQLAPDGFYYLTGTIPANLFSDKDPSVKFWRSKDLVEWETVGEVTYPKQSLFVKELKDAATKRNAKPEILSPKAFYIANRWVVVHTSNVLKMSNMMVSNSQDIKGDYTEPFGLDVGFQTDPAVFVDDDGAPWLLSFCTQVRRIKKDFSGFDGNHRLIGPKNRQLGFEGTSMLKIGMKYVLFGTSWSTDIYGKGTYNLYYTTADSILGPYGPRKFAARFVGNGIPFQDKNGRWWVTAFHKTDQSVVTIGELKGIDASDAAYTINKPGLTLVPLDIEIMNDEVYVTAKDSRYRYPGKEEVQQF